MASSPDIGNISTKRAARSANDTAMIPAIAQHPGSVSGHRRPRTPRTATNRGADRRSGTGAGSFPCCLVFAELLEASGLVADMQVIPCQLTRTLGETIAHGPKRRLGEGDLLQWFDLGEQLSPFV